MTGNWRDLANCLGADPEAFYPERGMPSHVAKKVCATCPVQTECLDWALANDEHHGIWGGTTERERRRLRRERAA